MNNNFNNEGYHFLTLAAPKVSPKPENIPTENLLETNAIGKKKIFSDI